MEFPIKNFLPHQPPMLMVDTVKRITVDEVETEFYIAADNIFVKENFFSETGLIENAAQTCSAISGQFYFTEEKPKNCTINPQVLGFISSIKKIQIHQLPQKETSISSKAILISHSQTDNYAICVLKVSVFNQDTLFLEGELNLFLQNKS
ncbi:MAG TPA: hypothetical protein VKY33_01985 [Flavobacterium sp.]|nr:hypothetical protein [Flavobacterium sp.]